MTDAGLVTTKQHRILKVPIFLETGEPQSWLAFKSNANYVKVEVNEVGKYVNITDKTKSPLGGLAALDMITIKEMVLLGRVV